jgi:GTP:adenosylcobinamide-phosphate guanylyltransferase
VVNADIPLITPEALNNFLTMVCDDTIDIYYPVVPKEIIQDRFPCAERTYVNLKEGIFTGGNLFLINPDIVEVCSEKGQEFVNLRKSPIKLCKLLGLPFVIKFLLHRLSMNEVECKVSSLMNIKGAGVISSYPEVGIDVDKPSDLELVIKEMLKAN